MIVGQDKSKPSLDELAHFGIKGMKWGVRNAPVDSSGSNAPPTRRQLKKMDKAARNSDIDAARARYNAAQQKAQATYLQQKKTLGNYRAEQNYQNAMKPHLDAYNMATQIKSGKEKTAAILAVVGVATIASVLKYAASRSLS